VVIQDTATTVAETLQRTVTHYDTLQRTATHCNTMQHTATHHVARDVVIKNNVIVQEQQ